MRAIVYGHNTETDEWVELLNKSGFWAFMNGLPFMIKRTIKLSKKHKMRTYLLLEKKRGTLALLPISFKTKYNGPSITYNGDFEQASEWRVRKTIPGLTLIGEGQRYWTKNVQFIPPSIMRLNSMDMFIEHWDSIEHNHINTISDFVINAVSELQDEAVLYEAQMIMENHEVFEEFYEELKPLGIKKETFKQASNKYFEFIEKILEEENEEL
ncbi:hypothetical protein [Mycoplasma todarodis]|nr:hypothetical protein [Mycoplasma todarodis]